MKLTPSEQKLVELISVMPGASYCPGPDATTTPEVRRIIRRLERKGVVNVEQTDDGPRFTVRESVNG